MIQTEARLQQVLEQVENRCRAVQSLNADSPLRSQTNPFGIADARSNGRQQRRVARPPSARATAAWLNFDDPEREEARRKLAQAGRYP